MFTGLVETVGRVIAVEPRPAGRRIEFEASAFAGELAAGDSIAINGCCLTAVDVRGTGFTVEVVEETLMRTTMGDLEQGAAVNLERALRIGDRIDGHLVQGHVDAVGEVRDATPMGDGQRIGFTLPRSIAAFVAEKGSVAVDGVSLTVAACTADGFQVAFIPYTLAHTIAGSYRPQRRVNLEVDLIARYVGRMLDSRRAEGSPS